MRLIDVDALIVDASFYDDEVDKARHGRFYYSVEQISNAPIVDAVEVVRCGECKNYSVDDPNDLICGYCDYWFNYHYRNEFCNYGERK